MKPIRRNLQSISTQVKGLPATAKMLIFALMIILTMSLFLVAQLAGRPTMVALPATLDPDERTKVLAHLEQSSVPYQERNGKILVPAEQKFSVIAQLAAQEVISGDQINWDLIIDQDSPFLTREQNRKRWLIAKMKVLSSLVSRFNGIDRATVVIDRPDSQGFGRTHISPTASVTVVPRGAGLSSDTIEAIADLVAGAQPGLKVQDVRIIDAKSGTSHAARNKGQLAASNHMEIKHAAEQHVKATIEGLLAAIPGVRVAVNVMPDTREVLQRTDNYEEPRIGPLSSNRRTIESTTQSRSAEPGIRPNTGVDITTGGISGSQFSDERSDETTKPVFPSDSRHITDHKGYALKINATILVPRMYFVTRYRSDRADPTAVPDDVELDPIIVSEAARIKSMVEPLIDTAAYPGASPGTVVVAMIPDMVQLVPGAPGDVPMAGVDSVPGLVGIPLDGSLLKYLLLGALALLSLLMMVLMVRKAGVQSQTVTVQEILGVPPKLPTDQSEVVGEADESTPAMEGLELDAEALRRKQMLGQISDMVRQNPDEVANLLRRWMKVQA